MATIRLKLATTAPLFLKGADPRGDPEFRASSIRGQLRYWLRAIAGAETQNLSEVWARENAVFGSTERGSVVTVRVSKGVQQPMSEHDDEPRDGRGRYKPYLLPHRQNDREKSPDYAIRPGTAVFLTLSTRPAVKIPADVLKALSLWLLLGGVGKRSRRMMGGLQLSTVNDGTDYLPEWMTVIPENVDLWAQWYKYELERVLGVIPSPAQQPSFPTLHPNHCCVLVGQRLFPSANDANIALFRGLLRTKFLNDETMFGFAGGGGRRASPVIAQVRKVGDDYFPVFTIFRSPIQRPRGAPGDWGILNRFIDALINDFQATIVYGGKFS